MAYEPLQSYDVAPKPRGGSGPFGGVPGTVQLPSPYTDLWKVNSQLFKQNQAISGALGRHIGGEISDDSLDFLQDRNAAKALGMGVGGSGFADNMLIKSVGDYSQNLQKEGLGDYSPLIRQISRTQTVSPDTATAIAKMNALNQAMPDPNAAGIMKALSGLAGYAAQGGFGSYGTGNQGYGGYNFDYSNFQNPTFSPIYSPSNYGGLDAYGSPSGDFEVNADFGGYA